MTVSEWAEKYRILSRGSCPEPGAWRNKRTPYLVEIMDAFGDPAIGMITVMTSSQVGKTSTIENVIGYYIAEDPCPIMHIQPTLSLAEELSKDRLAPMIRDTPRLKAKVLSAKAKQGDNTLLHKRFMGGTLFLAGANSPASLASKPVRLLLFDEVDRYPSSAGTEGDPVLLGMARTKNFWNRKIGLFSTPTDESASRILQSWEQSDQRRYFMPCLHCGEFHLFEFKNLAWEPGRPETAKHACPHCGVLQADGEKPEMLARGKWVQGKPEVVGHAGFHLWEACSPWRSFGDIAHSFLEAKGDPETLRVWINTCLGEVWKEAKDATPVENLVKRQENYDNQLVPMGGVVITMGVDVQDDRLELEIMAWGKGKESWSLEYVVIPGSPAEAFVWDQLDGYIRKTYRHESGAHLRVMGCGIDSGGHHTEEVYLFCKPRFGQRVFALKGASITGKPLVSGPSKSNYGKVHLYTVGTESAKDTFTANLAKEAPGPGYCHFPHNYPESYFRQLLSERPVIRMVKGKRMRQWATVKKNTRNEALDCRIYNMSVLRILGENIIETASQKLAMFSKLGYGYKGDTVKDGDDRTQKRRRRTRSKGIQPLR